MVVVVVKVIILARTNFSGSRNKNKHNNITFKENVQNTTKSDYNKRI